MLFFVPAFALPIGVLVFFFSAVPIFGAIVSGIIASILVLVSQGWVAALIMGVIVLLVQQTESSILLPLLLGKTVSLHPVAVVLAVTGGVMVAGLAGAIFAVPLVAVINTMVQYLFGNDKFPHLGEADHIPLLRRPDIGETVAGWQDQIRRVVSRPLRGSDDDDEYDDDEYDDDNPGSGTPGNDPFDVDEFGLEAELTETELDLGTSKERRRRHREDKVRPQRRIRRGRSARRHRRRNKNRAKTEAKLSGDAASVAETELELEVS